MGAKNQRRGFSANGWSRRRVSIEVLMMFAVAVVCSLATIPLTTLATRLMLLRLPADHFVRPRRSWEEAWSGSFWKKLGTVARNLSGVLLLIAGGIMSIPGIPGPGLLTMLIALYLIEFPGKLGLQRRVLQAGRLRVRVDRLRARHGRPALQFPGLAEDDARAGL